MAPRCRNHQRDLGAGGLEFVAIVMLISAISGALIMSGLPGTVSGGIRAAICRILRESDCPATGTTQPVAVDPYEPQQDCWTTIRDATVEGVANVKIIRVLGVRAGRRVTVTTRRVQHPDGTITYDVIISPNVEVGVTGGLPVPAKASVNIDIWAAVQSTAGDIYSFNASDYGGDEDKAKDAATKFADKLWLDKAQDDAISAAAGTDPVLGVATRIPGVKGAIKKGLGWLIGKTAPVTKHLPIVGDNIERAAQSPDRDLDKPDQSFVEGGPTVGWGGGARLNMALGLNTNGRGFVNAGVRTNYGSDKYYRNIYFKMNGEAEIAPTLDLGSWIPKNTGKNSKAFDDFVAQVEQEIFAKTGKLVTIPASVRTALQASWPKVAFSAKVKAARMYMLSEDKQGNPTQLRTITESQYVFSVAGMGGQKFDNGAVSAFVQTSITGRKYNTQSILDLDGPEHAENLQQADRFLQQTVRDATTNPIAATGDFFDLSADAQEFGDYIKRNGQTYQQIWDSKVTTYVGSGDAGVAKGYLLYEPETNNLSGAQYYNPDRGWLPWTVCKLGE